MSILRHYRVVPFVLAMVIILCSPPTRYAIQPPGLTPAQGFEVSDDFPTYAGDWRVTWSGLDLGIGRHIATDTVRNVFIAGWIDQNGGDVFIRKYSESGVFQWETDWGNGSQETIKDITALSSGHVVITGYRTVGSTNEKFIACFNSNGDQVWNKTYGEGLFGAIDATQDDNLVLYAVNNDNAEVVQYTPIGVKVWNYTMWDARPMADIDLSIDPSGNIYFMGRMGFFNDGDPYSDACLYKLDSTGSYQWDIQVGSGDNNYVRDIAFDKDGNVYIDGFYTNATYQDQQVYVEKYTLQGLFQWSVESQNSRSSAYPQGLEVASTGRIYFRGDGLSDTHFEFWITPSGIVERTIYSDDTSREIQAMEMDNMDNLLFGTMDGLTYGLEKRFNDTAAPVIQAPDVFKMELGSTGNVLRWNISESDTRYYWLYRDGLALYIDVTPDTDFVLVSGQLDILSLGNYTFVLVVEDWNGNTASAAVTVQVVEVDTTNDSSSTTTGNEDPMQTVLMTVGIAALLAVLVVVVLVARKRTERSSGLPVGKVVVSHGVDVPGTNVKVLRGAEFVGNKLRYKVKITNDSAFVITDATVTLVAYPRDSLRIDGEVTKVVPKIDPDGFRSPSFEFSPTQDCVKGTISATVSFVDYQGKLYSAITEPYEIRAVCDLLTPESITPEDFDLRLTDLDRNGTTVKVEDWTPEEMKEKTMEALKHSNFFRVSEHSAVEDGVSEARVTGWAKGKYTGKHVGVQVTITGTPNVKGATCKLQVIGDDGAMLPPALDEVSKRLNSWLCPRCNGVLPIEIVQELKLSSCCACPFCGVAIDL